MRASIRPGAKVAVGAAQLLGFNIVALAAEDPERARQYGLQALDMAAAGRVDLDVSRVVPLAQAATVHEWIDARTTTGKVLLDVAGADL